MTGSAASLRPLPILGAPARGCRLGEVVVVVGVLAEIGEVTVDRGGPDGGSGTPDVLVLGQPGGQLPLLIALLATHAHAPAGHRQEERHRAGATATSRPRDLGTTARRPGKPAA